MARRGAVVPQVRSVLVSGLVPYANNARTHSEAQVAEIAESIKHFGWTVPILIDENGGVLAGHGRLLAAKSMGLGRVPAIMATGMSEEQKRAYILADNKLAENAGWDDALLKAELADLRALGADLQVIGFDERELRKIFGNEDLEAPEPQLDKAAALQKKWKTKRGQIWEIGEHRLMCGDSKTDVAELFDVRKAWLLCTDPPYGVGYGVTSGPDSAKRFDPMGNDGDDGPALQAFLEDIFRAALPHLESGCAWYLWHAQMTQGFFAAAAAAAAQVKIHRQIIWAKSHFILGHGDYHWQHELCFYGWREGEKHRWFAGRDLSTLWVIDNPRVHEHHPTEKPPELFWRAMFANTKVGDICYEPFAGSGSQFCAAQAKERICYGMGNRAEICCRSA